MRRRSSQTARAALDPRARRTLRPRATSCSRRPPHRTASAAPTFGTTPRSPPTRTTPGSTIGP
eukprot:647286-Alexandrium_andersonii.AAC.1